MSINMRFVILFDMFLDPSFKMTASFANITIIPLAPVLANIFVGFYESQWLNEYNHNKPKFYLRYVDEIIDARNKIH